MSPISDLLSERKLQKHEYTPHRPEVNDNYRNIIWKMKRMIKGGPSVSRLGDTEDRKVFIEDYIRRSLGYTECQKLGMDKLS